MSVTDWKLEKDLCRCCHAEGSFKNLSVPCYKYDGEEEIYVDMIRDHMNLDIIQVQGALQSVTFTICDLCIAKLRDVTTFRRQVMSCEERFRDMYSRNVFKVGETTPDVKVEVIELDDFGDVKGEDNDDDDFTMNFSDEEDIKAEVLIDIKQEPSKKGKGKGKATPKAKKRPAPKRAAKAKKGKKAGGDGEEDKVDDADKAEDEAEATASLADTTKRASKRGAAGGEEAIPGYYVINGKNGEKRLRCSKCSVSHAPAELNRLEDHYKFVHQCSYCMLVFKSINNKKEHIKQTHASEPSEEGTCDICERQFDSYSAYREHMYRFHIAVDCDKCGESFPNRRKLAIHMSQKHVEKLQCDLCSYKTALPRILEQHKRRVHLKEKNAKCPQCDYTCFDRHVLRDHAQMHVKNKFKVVCQYCGKKFNRRDSLKYHVRIHTGEKRYVCKVCGSAFVQKTSLDHHAKKCRPESTTASVASSVAE